MKIIIVFIVFFTANIVSAQQDMHLANRYFENTYYSEAIPLYEKAASGKQTFEMIRNLAHSYYYTGDFQNAQKWFAVLAKKFPKEIKEDDRFLYVHSLKATGNYKAAYDELRMHVNGEAAIAKLESSIKLLQKLTARGSRYTIKLLPFNTKNSEFGAVERNDSLVFTGSSKSAAKVYKWNNESYLNLQVIALKDTTVVDLTAKGFGSEINTAMHDGNAIFTMDGNTMYFTRNNFKDGKRAQDQSKTSHLQIYRAERIGGRWTNVVAMPFNSDSYSTAHPVLSPDERTLYFASDMPGSLGSFDIYSVTIAEGAYSIPTNITAVNTVHKEQFPFVSTDNKLYFSSDGHFGYGALDVFVSKIDGGEFSAPINVGPEVNSGYDDFSFTINAATKKGYFASNRPTGKGSDDIYSLTEKPYDANNLSDDGTSVNPDGSPIAANNIDDMFSAISKEADVVTINGRLVIKTAPIYFDYDLWYIRKESKPILDRVIQLMIQYPEIVVEIGSHTDVRGDDEYNRELSSKRAASTRTYFIENGIPSDRVTSKGYGETVPIIRCVPETACSEEQHELNRRSEFVIIGTK